MDIEFTQFLFPDGLRKPVFIDRPAEIAIKAQSLKLIGFKFEIENKYEKIWMSIVNHKKDIAYDEYCPNGPEVPLMIDRMINEAHENEVQSHIQEITMQPNERDEVTERFGPYRRPTDTTIPKYKLIQEKCLELALLINDICPHSKQKATALTQLEMCKMSANAAIAIHTKEL